YRVLCSVAGREGEIATDQIRTVDKSRLKRKIGDLNFSEIKRLREVFQQMFCE
ncbi:MULTISPECIES: type II toxin-antitoxin system PemK/MazF family toxin, partial [Bacteroidaceae]